MQRYLLVNKPGTVRNKHETKIVPTLVTASFLLLSFTSNAGALKADCSPAKAGKNAAMKATVGVGGRSSPADAARDSAKGATGFDGDDNGQGQDKGKHQ